MRSCKLLVVLGATLALSPLAPAQAGTATDEMIACAALGPKRPGTDADRRMGDRLLERFRAAGLETSAEEFHMPVWKPAKSALRIASGSGAGEDIHAESFAYSGTGKLEGVELYDAGQGAPADLAGAKGKVVLVDNSATYHRTVQVENLMAAGAVAMVYVSASPRNLVQTGAVRWGQRPPASIPTLTVGTQAGDGLRGHLAKGPVKVDLDVQGERLDAVTRNIVGMRKGTRYPDRYIVVAGHYDSWHAGANDNCTAVGTLLAAVEANKNQAPAYTMIYIGWGAEETGLVGSYEWIREHQDLMPNVAMNINLEETASATFSDGDPTQIPGLVLATGSTSPAMQALVTSAATANLVVPPVVIPLTAYRAASGGIIATDIEGFYASGVQGFSTASASPYYHTTEDTQDKINLGDLERTTSYITQVTQLAQVVPPEGFTLREVPTVKVTAPKTAAPGAAVPIDIRVTGVDGRPVSNDPVRVLADQKDNWAVAESFATPIGEGRYTWTLSAGSTDADVTDIRATTSTTAYLAQGYARIDMRSGGLTPAGTSCRSRRVLTLNVRGRVGGRKVRSLRVSVTRGRHRVARTATGYRVRLDMRGVAKGTVRVKLSARTAKGTVVQTRTYRTCVGR